MSHAWTAAGAARRNAGRVTRALGLAGAVALLGLTTIPAAAWALAFSGATCRESLVTFAVPVDRAQAALPDGWTPSTDAAGQAVVGVGVLACESLTVEHKTTRGQAVSDVGIQVVSPEDGFPAWYQLWQHNSSAHLHKAMAELGVAGDHAKLEDRLTAGPLREVSSTVDAPAGDYGLSASLLGPAPLGDANPVWWHDGPKGTVKLTYRISGASGEAGPGRLWAQPGTPLARLAGTERDAAGAFLTFPGFTATAQRWPSGA